MWIARHVALAVLLGGSLGLSCGGSSKFDDRTGGGGSGASGAGTGGSVDSGGAAGSGSGVGGDSGGTAGLPHGGTSGAGAESGSTPGGSGGSLAGSSGETGGSSGAASGAAGGGNGGTGELVPCNTTTGSGCDVDQLCLPVDTGECVPSANDACDGYCAETLTPTGCGAGLAQCSGIVTCAAVPQECPAGFVNSILGNCYGPCVPADCCACTTEGDCWFEDASCNPVEGRCAVPAAPEPRCLLPFEPEGCTGYPRAFVFVEGACHEQEEGVCNFNGNSFDTLEECLRRCEGSPQQSECPAGRVPRLTCLGCGPLGGCTKHGTVCVETCTTSEECSFGTCDGETCGAFFCI